MIGLGAECRQPLSVRLLPFCGVRQCFALPLLFLVFCLCFFLTPQENKKKTKAAEQNTAALQSKNKKQKRQSKATAALHKKAEVELTSSSKPLPESSATIRAKGTLYCGRWSARR